MRIKFLFALIPLLAPLVAAQRIDPDDDDRQAARQEWFYSQRAYPIGSIPAGARLNAIREIQRIDRAARSLRRSNPARSPLANAAVTMDSTNWTLIGPQPTNAGSTSVTSGRVNSIAIDPRDNNTVYIGAAEGGVWKTTDGGVSWLPLTDAQVSLASGAIALDPQNPDIVYVGTGEDNYAQDAYYGAGILKSTDAGNTWTNIVGPFLRDKISAIAIAPDSSSILCASTQGLWRSTDGAATWKYIPQTKYGTSIVFDPSNASSVYMALGYPNGLTTNGVYHSTDGGVTWTQFPAGTAAGMLPAANVGRIEIALAPSAPSTLYVQISDSSNSAFGRLLGIYKSTDGGATWSKLAISNPTLWGNQLWYDNPIRVSPTDPNVVWAGGLLVYRSLDGGVSWTEPAQAGPNGALLHVDEHVFAFTSDGTKLYIGGDGGMYSTTDISAARINWTELNTTLAITQLYPGLSIHPANPQIALVGAQDNGTQRFGGAPSWDNVACGDGGYTAIDSSMPSFAYASCQYSSPQRILDLAAGSWVPANYGIDQTDLVAFIAPLAMDLSNPQTLYFGTYRLWQTLDSGGYWNAVSADFTGGKKGTISAIAVAPSDSNTIYLATTNNKIQVTSDMQDGAKAVFTDRSAGLPLLAVTHLAIDAVDPATAYITYSGFPTNSAGHVYKTSNSGATWTNASGNLPNIPVNALVIDPDLPSTLYVGTDAGVMVSTDGGGTWSTLGMGLPNVVVTSLTLHRSSRILRAGTHGRSVWDILVPLAGTSQQPSITSISPATANAPGADMTLTVAGSGFGSSTVVRWNGQSRTTTLVDGSHLTAAIPASDTALIGRAAVTVLNSSTGGGVSNAVPFMIGPGPATSSAAAVSAANPLGGAVLGQRSISSLYGTNLSPQTVNANLAPPLPFTLGGTTMTIGGNEVALFYVSPGLVNFQVPFLSVLAPTKVPLVLNQGGQSTTVTVTIQPYAPALFTTNGGGTGQASALIANTASIAAPAGTFPGSRPIHIGEYLSIYCTGLGDVNPRPAIGAPSPSNPISKTLTNPAVTIGGVPGIVSFSGLAPGFASLYLVNVQIPDTAPLGAAVPIVLSIGGLVSNTATVAIDASALGQ